MGAKVYVCGVCRPLGREVETAKAQNRDHNFTRKRVQEQEEVLVREDAYQIIQKSLSEKGWTSNHLARAINLKGSTLQKMLNRKLCLDIDTAKRIGDFLKVTLIYNESPKEDIEERHMTTKDSTKSTMEDFFYDKIRKLRS